MTNKSVTVQSISDKIKSETYVVLEGTTTTVCALTLENGYIVTGESACVDPANFDKAKGEKYSRERAFEKIWTLEGYLLKERLYQESKVGSV
jgi:hypothetical protein